MAGDNRTECVVRDGRFVEPCNGLESQADLIGLDRRKSFGIGRWEYSNIRTGKKTRTFYGVKSRANPDGMAFNFCPWCGTKIDAPFNPDARENRAAQAMEAPEGGETRSGSTEGDSAVAKPCAQDPSGSSKHG